MFYHLSYSERQEQLLAQIERFRNGEIGPATFREKCEELRTPRDEIEEYIHELSNECADNILKSRGYGKGQD